MIAYILLSLQGGQEQEVLAKILEKPTVKEAHVIFGEWDLIAKIEVVNPDEFTSLVVAIRSWREVKTTTTMMVAR